MWQKIVVFLTYDIDLCGQSSTDDDKQELFADFFRSRCWFNWRFFSSSVVMVVAGKDNGGGGNFFDRDNKFAADEFVSIWCRSPRLTLLILFLTTIRYFLQKQTERRKEKHQYGDPHFFSFFFTIDLRIFTFIAKPDGINPLGQSNSVVCIRIPDSISNTPLSSGLDNSNNILSKFLWIYLLWKFN